MDKKKIVHIIGGLGIGGAETAVVNSLKYVDWNKFEFVFVCFGKERKFDYTEIIEGFPNCSIRFINKPNIKNPYKHIREIRWLISDIGDVSVIHIYTLLHSAIVIKAIKNSIPVVVHAHSSADNSLKSGKIRSLYERYSKRIIQKSSSKLISCGEEAGKYLFSDKDFEIIYNGIDTDLIKNLEKNDKSLDNETDIFRIGIFGRLIDVKNHKFALEVLSELIISHKNIMLYIVGEGELKSEIQQYMYDLRLEKNVVFLGLRRDIFNLMQQVDLLWMPSKFEGFPMVLIEAQAVGLVSLVSSNVDKIVDLDLDLINFYPLKKKEWIKATESFLLNIKQYNRCYDYTEILNQKGFSSEHYAKEMERIYYNMIGE